MILGGCCVSDFDSSWQCKDCGAHIYDEKLKRNLKKVEIVFNADFSNWNIRLPKKDIQQRKSGKINKAGWAIWYLFGKNEKGEYLDYYASHRMTNDRHIRIYFDGCCESLPAIRDMRIASKDPEEDAKLAAKFDRRKDPTGERLGFSGDEPWSV